MTDDAFASRWSEWTGRYAAGAVSTELDVPLFLRATRTRSRTLADPTAPAGPGAFALVADGGFAYDEKAVAKWLRKGEPSGFARLAELRDVVAGIEPFTPDAVEAAVGAWCQAREIGLGKAAQPLRVAVTGSAASPPLGETLAILGRESVLARVDRCLRENSP